MVSKKSNILHNTSVIFIYSNEKQGITLLFKFFL